MIVSLYHLCSLTTYLTSDLVIFLVAIRLHTISGVNLRNLFCY